MDGFVLCGGLSQRMGQDKARMLIEGVPAAVHLARVLGEAGCDRVALVSKPGVHDDLGVEVVHDSLAARHPAAGLVAGLEASRSPVALFVPTDLIEVEPVDIRGLMAAAPAVAEHAGRRHPLFSALPASMCEALRQGVAAGASVRDLTQELPGYDPGERAVHNANRPEDWRRHGSR